MKHLPIRARRVLGLLLGLELTLVLVTDGRAADRPATPEGPRDIEERRTPDQVRFGLIGAADKSPSPTLFVFAHGLEVMRREPVYTEVADILSRQGWVSVVVEPPCHGEDVRPGEPEQLAGWRHRIERGEDIIAAFNAKATAILDHLVKEGVTDPQRVAVYGVSRGGFLAFHFAATEPRVKAAAGISPVTKLMALREFDGVTERAKVERLDVVQLAPKLAGRAVWLSIGNNDARVKTDDAIEFTRGVVRATASHENPDEVIPVDLLVGPAAGHSKMDQAHEKLGAWLLSRFPSAPAAP